MHVFQSIGSDWQIRRVAEDSFHRGAYEGDGRGGVDDTDDLHTMLDQKAAAFFTGPEARSSLDLPSDIAANNANLAWFDLTRPDPGDDVGRNPTRLICAGAPYS